MTSEYEKALDSTIAWEKSDRKTGNNVYKRRQIFIKTVEKMLTELEMEYEKNGNTAEIEGGALTIALRLDSGNQVEVTARFGKPPK